MNHNSDVVRQYFAAYVSSDEEAINTLLADDFTFTSPLDDRISRERYFRRCWPNHAHISNIRIQKLFVDGDEAFVQYESERKEEPVVRNTEFFQFRDGKISHVTVYFGNAAERIGREGEIRAILSDWAEAIRAKNVEGAVSHFSDDAVIFDLAPPLQSREPMRRSLAGWFGSFRGGLGYEIRDLNIITSSNLAYTTSLNHLIGEKIDGAQADVWFRETLCLRQNDGKWLITHAHESVPFHMDGSDRAALDLRPVEEPEN